MQFCVTEPQTLEKPEEDIDGQRKHIDLSALTPNLISDQERSENNASPTAERILNLSYRQSPNAEKLKLYFEKKG